MGRQNLHPAHDECFEMKGEDSTDFVFHGWFRKLLRSERRDIVSFWNGKSFIHDGICLKSSDQNETAYG